MTIMSKNRPFQGLLMSKMATALFVVRSRPMNAKVRPAHVEQRDAFGLDAFVGATAVVVDPALVRFPVEDAAAVPDQGAVGATDEKDRAPAANRLPGEESLFETRRRFSGAGATAPKSLPRDTIGVVLAEISFVGHHQERDAEPVVEGTESGI